MGNWYALGLLEKKFWLINKPQLIPLGITEQHVHFVLGFLGIVCCYALFRPLLRLLVLLQWDRLLTYAYGSVVLLFIVSFFEALQAVKFSKEINLDYIADATLGIMGFGAVLFIVQFFQAFTSRLKGKKSKST